MDLKSHLTLAPWGLQALGVTPAFQYGQKERARRLQHKVHRCIECSRYSVTPIMRPIRDSKRQSVDPAMKSVNLVLIIGLAFAGTAYGQVPSGNDTSDGSGNTGMGTGALRFNSIG